MSAMIILAFTLLLGYSFAWFRLFLSEKNFYRLEQAIYRAQDISIATLMPISYFITLWNLNLTDMRVIALPVTGAIMILGGALLSFLFARMLRWPVPAQGAMLNAGGMTNLGAMGAFTCLAWLGTSSVTLVSFYLLFETLIYFGLLFPVTQWLKSRDSNILAMLKGPEMRYSLRLALVFSISLFSGLGLSISGIERPLWLDHITDILVPVATIMLMCAVGFRFRLLYLKTAWKAGVVMLLLRLVLLPGIVFVVYRLLGLDQLMDGQLMAVALILASMPVGGTVTLAARVLKTDMSTALGSWAYSTIGILIWGPVLHMFINTLH